MVILNYNACGWVHSASCNGVIKIPQDIKDRVNISTDWNYLLTLDDVQVNPQIIYSELCKILFAITEEYHGNTREIFELIKSRKFNLPLYESICTDNLQDSVDILIREFYTYWIRCMVRYHTNQMKYQKINTPICPHITLTIRNKKCVVSKYIHYFYSFKYWVYWLEGMPSAKILDPLNMFPRIRVAPNYVVTHDDIVNYLHSKYPDAIMVYAKIIE